MEQNWTRIGMDNLIDVLFFFVSGIEIEERIERATELEPARNS